MAVGSALLQDEGACRDSGRNGQSRGQWREGETRQAASRWRFSPNSTGALLPHRYGRAVSEHRGPASIAATLYEETEEGRKSREAMQLQVKAAQVMSGYDRGRPTKKDRRDIERLKRRDTI